MLMHQMCAFPVLGRGTVYACVKEPSTERASANFGLFRMLRRRYKKIRANVDIVGQMCLEYLDL